MINNVYVSGIIIALLLINACYHINKQTYARRYCVTHVQLAELQLKNTGYLIINIICVFLICLL